MNARQWKRVNGVVAAGHRVASGLASDSPYPRGTIEIQTPFFQALGVDLDNYFKGTLNISIAPSTFQLIQPEFIFRGVEWTDRHPPEDFSFSRCQILVHAVTYSGWIYYPHPETKMRNFQNPSIIEIIAPQIPGIGYGDPVTVEYDSLEIALLMI
jgi:hypothetical protein